MQIIVLRTKNHLAESDFFVLSMFFAFSQYNGE